MVVAQVVSQSQSARIGGIPSHTPCSYPLHLTTQATARDVKAALGMGCSAGTAAPQGRAARGTNKRGYNIVAAVAAYAGHFRSFHCNDPEWALWGGDFEFVVWAISTGKPVLVVSVRPQLQQFTWRPCIWLALPSPAQIGLRSVPCFHLCELTTHGGRPAFPRRILREDSSEVAPVVVAFNGRDHYWATYRVLATLPEGLVLPTVDVQLLAWPRE